MKKFSIRELFSLSWKDYKKNWLIAIIALIPLAILFIIDGIFGIQEEGKWVGEEWVSSGMSMGVTEVTVSIIIFFTTLFIMIGLIRVYLSIVDGKKADFWQNFKGVDSVKHYFMYLLTYITAILAIFLPLVLIGFASNTFVYKLINLDYEITGAVIILLGFIFILTLIITFYLVVALQFAYYLSIENRYHFITALKKSWVMTKGARGKLFILILLMISVLLVPLMLIVLITGILSTINIVLAMIIGGLLTISFIAIILPIHLLIYAHLYRKLDPEIPSRELPVTEEVEIEIENK